MKKDILLPLSTALILAGSLIPIQFAHSVTQSDGNTHLAAGEGPDAWRNEYIRQQQKEIERQNRLMNEAARRAEQARTRREWQKAMKQAEEADRRRREAEYRRSLPLEPIPK